MSNRYNNGSHYENHRRAAELHDIAAHAHLAAQQNGKQDHVTAHEHSRQALEHSEAAHRQTNLATNRHGHVTFAHAEIALLAHRLWEARGCPEGKPEEDWFQAVDQLAAAS